MYRPAGSEIVPIVITCNVGTADSAALEVFALTARRYPHSANAWESYSEALEKAGRRKEALETSKRALTLAPPQNVRDAAEARVKRLSQR